MLSPNQREALINLIGSLDTKVQISRATAFVNSLPLCEQIPLLQALGMAVENASSKDKITEDDERRRTFNPFRRKVRS